MKPGAEAQTESQQPASLRLPCCIAILELPPRASLSCLPVRLSAFLLFPHHPPLPFIFPPTLSWFLSHFFLFSTSQPSFHPTYQAITISLVLPLTHKAAFPPICHPHLTSPPSFSLSSLFFILVVHISYSTSLASTPFFYLSLALLLLLFIPTLHNLPQPRRPAFLRDPNRASTTVSSRQQHNTFAEAID